VPDFGGREKVECRCQDGEVFVRSPHVLRQMPHAFDPANGKLRHIVAWRSVQEAKAEPLPVLAEVRVPAGSIQPGQPVKVSFELRRQEATPPEADRGEPCEFKVVRMEPVGEMVPAPVITYTPPHAISFHPGPDEPGVGGALAALLSSLPAETLARFGLVGTPVAATATIPAGFAIDAAPAPQVEVEPRSVRITGTTTISAIAESDADARAAERLATKLGLNYGHTVIHSEADIKVPPLDGKSLPTPAPASSPYLIEAPLGKRQLWGA